MSHALLLRLFLSPFFSVHVALQYLKTYPENIGITHYLTSRLRSMPTREVEFYWPELCHLLVTRPSRSVALERFILDRAEESTHSAMLTFWFMQAALCDLAPDRALNPQPFNICQRVLLQCHEIIFADPPAPSARSPYSTRRISLDGVRNLLTPASSTGGDRQRKKLKVANVEAVVLGLGLIAGAVGGERALRDMREVAVLQGSRGGEPKESLVAPQEENGEGGSGGADGPTKMVRPSQQQDRAAGSAAAAEVGGESADGSFEELADGSINGTVTTAPSGVASPALVKRPTFLITDDSSRASSPEPSARLPAATSPSLPLPPSLLRQQSTSDPFSQLDLPIHTLSSLPSALRPKPLAPSHSTPALSSLGPVVPPRNDPEELLKAYSIKDQERLLRSHYCRSEVRFLIALEEIANRLLVIPKPARVSALRAELTSLNHMLPAEVCMPTWCESDHGHEKGGETAAGLPLKARASFSGTTPAHKAHHRVVRISPGDSVVLNSAERAPYLIHVEVLTGDLDFDPAKRSNRDLLRKIVSGEEKKKAGFGGKGAGGLGSNGVVVGFGGPLPDPLHPLAGIHSGAPDQEDASTVPTPETAVEPYVLTSGAAASTSTAVPSPLANGSIGRSEPPDDGEEMDLVEQIYGANVSAADIDPELERRVPADLNPKNKDIDLAVWSRAMAIEEASSAKGRRRLPSLAQHLPPVPSGDVGSGSPSTSRWADGSPSGSGTASPTVAAGGFPSTAKHRQRPDSRDLQNDGGPSQAAASGSTSRTSLDPSRRELSLDDYSDRMRTAAVMLAQLSASATRDGAPPGPDAVKPGSSAAGSGTAGRSRWLPSLPTPKAAPAPEPITPGRKRLPPAEAEKIRERIMAEMLALEEERVERMTEKASDVGSLAGRTVASSTAIGDSKPMEDESIVRRELNKADPSAAVFSEAWSAKKARIRASSPWGHLATWDVFSVIVKTGADLRQEQLATQLLERFVRIWKEEKCGCWMRYFRILITGDTSGLVETIVDSVSVHSIKKAEYARRVAKGSAITHVSLYEHFVNTYGDPSSAQYQRAQRNFITSLAGYSVATYLLQIKDRHNGNILIDREGHLIHIDFGFMLSNSPGNMGFEAAPFKLTMEYVDIMGGIDSPGFATYKKLFKEGFEAARKHSDEIITIVDLMQYNSKLPCFTAFGNETAQHLRERFQLGLTQKAVDDHLERLIVSSIGSHWTRLYDSFQYFSEGVLF